jgi:hypothetical protein
MDEIMNIKCAIAENSQSPLSAECSSGEDFASKTFVVKYESTKKKYRLNVIHKEKR